MEPSNTVISEAVNRLVLELNKLPGIGPKSAQRIAFYLLRAPEEESRQLAEAVVSVRQNTRLCRRCFNVTDAELCSICRDEHREQNRLCIVEQPQDIVALEHARVFHGIYHVLHGALSPTEGVGTQDIRIRELVERLGRETITEVILATNTNLEGEQTALYLKRTLTPLGIKITRLARGLPFGAELEYADDVTLTRAFEGRQEF